jgi:phosphohistidine phosphatase SixA
MQLLAVLALAAQTAGGPAYSVELRGEELMKALQCGGYTILLRHARTDWSFKEEVGSVPVERSAQRNLSADGVRDAALMGVVLRRYRIPIGEIIASPMFRTRETAEYAAGTPTVSMALRVFPTTDETAALVAAAPKPGTNRLLVTHHFVIEKLVPGIKPGDVGESEAAVVRPTGDGHVALVGRITLSDWERLAGIPQTVPAKQVSQTTVPAPATPADPATQGAALTIPDTPAGRLARRYIDAFNSGDSARARAFIESSLVPNPNRSTETRVESWARSFQNLGPLSVVGVRSSSAAEVVLDIRAQNREYFLTAKVSVDDPARAASITIGTTQGGHP